MPFFSVIVPTYFRPKLCIESIKSILKQKFKSYEVIVICHGKENYTNFLRKNINNKKIKYLYIKDKYLSQARNFASKKAQGKWLSFLDDDDLWNENFLQILHKKILEMKNLDIVYSNYKTYDLLSKKYVNKSLVDYKKKYKSLQEALQYSNYVSGGSASAIRKKRFFDIGMFDKNLGGCEDHDFWRRAANKKYIFYFINKKLVIYRKSNSNLANNYKNQIIFEEMHLKKTLDELPYYLSGNFYNIECYHLLRSLSFSIKTLNFFIFLKNFYRINFFSKIIFIKLLINFILTRFLKIIFLKKKKKD